MNKAHAYIDRYRGLASGFLLVLAIHAFSELMTEPILFAAAVVLVVGAIMLAKRTARHFHYGHAHVGDSGLDALGGVVLIIANVLHPAVDGFSFSETLLRDGVLAGVLIGGSIVLHELLRQTALIAAFATLRIKWWWVVGTALLGLGLGVGAGFVGSVLFTRYEGYIDAATLFAYAFIIAEFYFSSQEERARSSSLFVVLGLVLGVVATSLL